MRQRPSSHAMCCIVFVLLVGSADAVRAQQPYEPTWESLKKHVDPDWFRDAKFGIYTHWGPVTVGSQDAKLGRVQWYVRAMYQPKDPAFQYHRDKFGDQKDFGYKDVIPLFKAEKFNADEWAKLFAAAGAQFAGPVAIHHDNFAMWDSALTDWNAMDTGPHRDITGELAKAIRGHGMKFIATFHHAFSWRYFEPSYAFDGNDPKYADLYLPHEPGAAPSTAFLNRWLGLVNEVVRKYEPELIWFDFGLGRVITPEFQQRMFADYYNWAAANSLEVGVAHKHRDIHEHTGILDFERGREDRLTPYPWLTDTAIGPWFHQKSVPYKTADQIIDVLVDIVSKNGCMLLNVGPAADGTIPPDAQKLLREIGAWLKINGEAVYATRPWQIYGEGPTRQEKGGGFSENKDKPFTSKDVRFTRSKDGKTLYAILLGWPKLQVTLHSIQITRAAANAQVQLLGYDDAIRHMVNDKKQLVISIPPLTPKEQPCDHAFVFKLTGFQFALHPDAVSRGPEPNGLLLSELRGKVQRSRNRSTSWLQH